MGSNPAVFLLALEEVSMLRRGKRLLLELAPIAPVEDELPELEVVWLMFWF